MAIKLKLNDSGDFEVEKGTFSKIDRPKIDQENEEFLRYKEELPDLLRKFGPIEVVETSASAVFLRGPRHEKVKDIICEALGWRVTVWIDQQEGI